MTDHDVTDRTVDDVSAAPPVRRPERPTLLLLVVGACLALAAAVRVAPLVEGGIRLQRQCVSEDGYLMLTIARNIALGNGFSVSDGTVASNGTQPLNALIYALCFLATGADKLLGLYPVVAFQMVLAAVTALLVFRWTRRHFYRGDHATAVAVAAAALWFASPTSLMHTQNSLETGTCALLVLASMALYDAVSPRFFEHRCFSASLCLGSLLGAAFLARNDACFLVAALLAVHLYRAHRRVVLARGLGQAVVVGLSSVLVAVPWLWFNLSRFGHPVPISGRAEALGVTFGHNFREALPALIENVLIVVRIPTSLQNLAGVEVISGLLLVLVLVAALAKRRWLAARYSPGVAILAGYSALLVLYYALFFGMPSFLGRYFFHVFTLAVLVIPGVCAAILRSLPGRLPAFATVALVASGAALCTGLNVRIYQKGTEHLHAQVVDWVSANVADGTWVGAVQTGTLGYYHDRTINLDGKVDPGAYAARRDGLIHRYVIERDVRYIADWHGIAEWAHRPEFAANYALLVDDARNNLAVLKRRTAVSAAMGEAVWRGAPNRAGAGQATSGAR